MLLEIHNLKTYFQQGSAQLKAVDGIDLAVAEGEVLGLVGESGCGKSVTSLSILNLISSPGHIVDGQILWKGENILNFSQDRLRRLRGKEISMIFQNPQGSLNPVFTVGNQMIETIVLHQHCNKTTAKAKAIQLLQEVGIADPESRLNNYPHELSGGMAQRVMIAIALSSKPDLLIADEPTAALDVTIQAQIMKLLADLRAKHGLAVLLISHDLGVIAQLCDRIAIMYLGKIVETATATNLFKTPLHPYTQALLKSVPMPDPENKNSFEPLKGDIPSPVNLPPGCRFASRCPLKIEKCVENEPTLDEKKSEHLAACWLVE